MRECFRRDWLCECVLGETGCESALGETGCVSALGETGCESVLWERLAVGVCFGRDWLWECALSYSMNLLLKPYCSIHAERKKKGGSTGTHAIRQPGKD